MGNVIIEFQICSWRAPKTKSKKEKANILLDKWAKPAMTRRVLRKTTNGEHLTMIKKDYGIKRGVVEELTAFPLGTYCILEKTDVANLAQKTLSKSLPKQSGKRFLECSCIDGLKGSAACVHKLAIEMALGDRPTHFTKRSGRPKSS